MAKSPEAETASMPRTLPVKLDNCTRIWIWRFKKGKRARKPRRGDLDLVLRRDESGQGVMQGIGILFAQAFVDFGIVGAKYCVCLFSGYAPVFA